MTTPNAALQQQGAAFQALIGDASKLLVDAAERSDTVDGLGIDERIKLGHSLVDLWVKSYIAVLQAFIAGPGLGSASALASEPWPSEEITVEAKPYPRQFRVDAPFERVGISTLTIPKSCIGFQPEFLPAGISQFRIMVTDYRFIGANYTGKITLTCSTVASLGPQDQVPDEKVVTVGL